MSDDRNQRQATLSAADIAALTEHHRLAPTYGSPLAVQPAGSGRTDYARLESRGLLDAGWRQALAVLAAPTRQVRALIPGPDATLIPILYATRDQGWVGCWPDGPGMLVTFPWDADRILAMGYQVLMAEEPPPPDGLSLSLSLPGLTALASVIDALRAFLFRSLLNRLTFASPVLTRPELTGHLEKGLLNPDTRWLVSLLDVAGSPHFRLAPQELPAGVGELERMGLLVATGEGWQPVPSVQRLALMWRSVLPAFALESIVADDNGTLSQYGHRIVIRGDGPLWQIDYGKDLWSKTPSVTLRDVGPLECFNGLQALLADPPSSPSRVSRQKETVAQPSAQVQRTRKEAPPTAPPAARDSTMRGTGRGGQPQAQAPVPLQLVALNGRLANQVFPMGREVTLGRSAENAIHLEDEKASRRHARISPQASGSVLEDLGSRNGTFVNGQRIDKAVLLQAGDQVQIGNSLFQVATPGRVEAVAAESTCPHCGHPVSPGARFCRRCGQPQP
ncbi:MAG: FHA domain-containing protein [Anaerolineae bacterium]